MSDTSAHPTPAPALYLGRQGICQYVATNSRGVQVLTGDGPGHFSPGDLLKIALAGYNAMSSDKRLADRFGKDFKQVIGVLGEYLSNEDRFASFTIELIQDLSKVGEEERVKLLRRVEGAAERSCTIARILTNSVSYTGIFTGEPVGQN